MSSFQLQPGARGMTLRSYRRDADHGWTGSFVIRISGRAGAEKRAEPAFFAFGCPGCRIGRWWPFQSKQFAGTQ